MYLAALVVVGRGAAQQTQLIVGIPTRVPHPLAEHIVTPRNPVARNISFPDTVLPPFQGGVGGLQSRQSLLYLRDQSRGKPLIGIEEQHPVAARRFQRTVALRRKVDEVANHHHCASRRGQLRRVIVGAIVEQHQQVVGQ